mmetsp:Transcript_4489/g.10580  ORF Transcript_4489/g.10580 Transcript_4489/m.10580 type:complete len:455 (+) Transcript_4489:597-1961(+)
MASRRTRERSTRPAGRPGLLPRLLPLLAILARSPQARAFAVGRSPTLRTAAIARPRWKATRDDETSHRDEPDPPPPPLWKLSPLGGDQNLACLDPLKEFPTAAMKERFRRSHPTGGTSGPLVAPGIVPGIVSGTTRGGGMRCNDNDVVVVVAAAPLGKRTGPSGIPAATKTPCPPLLLASREDVLPEKLVPSGGPPRAADAGDPVSRTKNLATGDTDDELLVLAEAGATIACGSTTWTRGGWSDKDPADHASTTTVFYLLDGFGCLTDKDGTRHYFGPGDTVVVPRNWSGRWDVAEDLHKIWFVINHAEVEEDKDSKEAADAEDASVPARVVHYNELAVLRPSPPGQSDDPHKSERRVYSTTASSNNNTDDDDDDETTVVSCVACTSPASAASFVVQPRKGADCFHVLEGSMVLVPSSGDGGPVAVSSGDTVVLPKDWTGRCEIVDPIRALRIR